MPCRVVTAKWVVSCTGITCIQPLSRCSLTLLASSFFSDSVCLLLLFCFLSLLFHHTSFFFIFGLLANSISLPDWAAILNFSFRLHLFTSRCFDKAGIVFLDGGWVSQGLVIGSCHSLFFLLACPFVSRVISFIYDVRVTGVVWTFNETSHFFSVWGSSWASVALPCCHC